MPSPRAPVFVFLAAFSTFLIAFALLLVLLKPVLDKQREKASLAEAGKPAVASLSNGTTKAATATPNPAPAKAPAATTTTAPATTTAPPATKTTAPKAAVDGGEAPRKRPSDRVAKDGAHDVEFTGRVVDGRGDVPKDAVVHLLIPSPDRKSDRFHHVASTPVEKNGRFTLTAKVAGSAAFLQAVAPSCVRSERKGFSVTGVGNVDAGELGLKAGVTVRVRVVGEDFNPITSAQVKLVDDGVDPEPLTRRQQAARTEADGTGVLRGVDSGQYTVQVSAPGHADAWSKLTVEGIVAGDSVISVTLPSAVAFVSGTVVDVQHNVIESGEVTVKMVLPKPSAAQTWRAPIQPGGNFRVGPLPRGKFEVDIAAKGLVQNGHVLAEADGEPVELVCEQGGIVMGRLHALVTQLARSPRISLFKRDEKGRLQPFDGAFRSEADPTTMRFRIDGLGPGSYVVRVLAEGFAPARSTPFDLEVGKTVDDVQVPLGDGGEVSGRLVGARGEPLSHARVTAFEGLAPPPQALQELFPADARQSVFSRDDGLFVLTGLSLGTQTLVVEMPGQPPRTVGPILVDAKNPSRFGDLTLGGGAILSVTLNDRSGRAAPFGAARLIRKDGGVDLLLVADEQGNFCLRGLPAGFFSLAGEGSESDHSDFALRNGDTKRVELPVKSR